MLRAALLIIVAVGGCDCGGDDPFIAVDLRSDFAAGTEIDRAETELTSGTSFDGSLTRRTFTIVDGIDLLDGVRVAELGGLAAGTYRLRVRVFLGATQRGERVITVTLRGSIVVTATITRNCEGVSCPEGTTCEDGACVDDRCHEEDPSTCGDRCTADTGCPSSGCYRGECDEGVCFSVLDESLCPTEDAGAPDGGPSDAGPPLMCTTDPACDDGNPCTDDGCFGGACDHVPNAVACDDGLFCNGFDSCAGGACGTHSGPPCAMCDETRDACLGCPADPCPDPSETTGPCDWADLCAEAATQIRTTRTWECVDGACVPDDVEVPIPCGRDTDGTMCSDTVVCSVPSCPYPDECAEAVLGTAERCSRYECVAGDCVDVSVAMPMMCSRATEGASCAGGQCCSGGCVDTQTSLIHCGGCGRSCSAASASVCSVGTCMCGAGAACGSRQLCCRGGGGNFRCGDPDGDPLNCGGCDLPCGENEGCVGGLCQCGATTGAPGEEACVVAGSAWCCNCTVLPYRCMSAGACVDPGC